MIVKVGEKLHVMTRRLFEGEVRRHFAGVVTESEGPLVRLEGYVFIYETTTNSWVKRPELRTRILSIADSNHIVKVIPQNVELSALTYKLTQHNHMFITDEKDFNLDINEFGTRR
jgi:hypothetical protein